MPNSINKPIKPDICIYHAKCMDGFGAAFAVWSKYYSDVQYIPGIYQQALSVDITDKNVVFVDFSYKRSIIEEMLTKAKSITILDHHESAINDLKDIPTSEKFITVFDMTRSGAKIAWDYYHNDSVYKEDQTPDLIYYIQDRDLWKHQLPSSKDVNSALASYEQDFGVWVSLAHRLEANYSTIADEGKSLTRKHLKDINDILSISTRTMVIGGHQVPVANVPYSMASDAGNILNVGRPFAATYYDGKDGRNFSLRSDSNGLNVSEIAQQYGGGGHKHAAGFKMPIGWEGDFNYNLTV